MQLKIWDEKAQALAEERTKHRAALETELRTLRAAQEEMAAKFDDSLTALQTASIQDYGLFIPSQPLCLYPFMPYTFIPYPLRGKQRTTRPALSPKEEGRQKGGGGWQEGFLQRGQA